METWEVWYPKAAANGLLVGRCRIDPVDRLIVHAAGDVVTVEVSNAAGAQRAFGQDLERTQPSPMCLLTIEGGAVTREDIWPGPEHIGLVVMLPGGEAGVLQDWWHADDRKEWRWQLEFYNSLR